MIYELLAGVILALSYFIGALIYFGTKDECVPFVDKHKGLNEVLSNSFYLIVISTAIIAGWLMTTVYKEITIALLFIPVIQMSICSVKRKHKEILKVAFISAGIFIVTFIISFSTFYFL